MEGRFQITYQIQADSIIEAEKIAEIIRVEQSVEMPVDALPKAGRQSLGDVVNIVESDKNQQWIVKISYPDEIAGNDLTQSLNILFGNISLYHGIKVIDTCDRFFQNNFPGPNFGLAGIRELLDRDNHLPLSCTALKPIGLSPVELADLALQFTRGGINIIKDDHGLTDQTMAPFQKRVSACSDAIRKGEQFSGKKTLYFPNITTSPSNVIKRYHEAIELGADGVLICPQLTGLEILAELAVIKEIPVMAHPAYSGGYIIHKTHGFAPEFYYGKLWRALGADSIIYPNAGGRFSLSIETCKRMNRQMQSAFCDYKKSVPTPAGGIHLDSIPNLLDQYGNDICYLIGGSLYQNPNGIEVATKTFTSLLEASNG